MLFIMRKRPPGPSPDDYLHIPTRLLPLAVLIESAAAKSPAPAGRAASAVAAAGLVVGVSDAGVDAFAADDGIESRDDFTIANFPPIITKREVQTKVCS